MAAGLALLAEGLLMAAVVVAPPRVVPLMVVVEGCWMEGEAEAAMEANKTSQCTLYPRSLWHKKEKNSLTLFTNSTSISSPSPHHPSALPSPYLHPHPTISLATSSPLPSSYLHPHPTLTPPSPSPHHLLTIHSSFHLLTFTLTLYMQPHIPSSISTPSYSHPYFQPFIPHLCLCVGASMEGSKICKVRLLRLRVRELGHCTSTRLEGRKVTKVRGS